MIRRIRYFFVLIPLVALVGCATSGVNKGDVNVVSISDEWKMGDQLAAQVAQQMQLVNDPTALSYVNKVGQQIVSQTEMANLPWHFHIVNDPSVNAFSIPGGHVYVNTGLINDASNAAELAGVMAHEIGHGVARHATEQLTKEYGLSIVAGLVLGQNPNILEQIVAQIATQGAVAKWSQADENEADRLGVHYMYQAGYDPQGMVMMFQTLLAERQQKPSKLEQWFSSHPLTESRIAKVKSEIQSLPAKPSLTMHESGFQTTKQRMSRYG